MSSKHLSFVTDTATMCIFDLVCLRHRLQDDPDWWAIPAHEVGEVNDANVGFLNLGEDGRYNVTILEERPIGACAFLNLKGPTGRFFIGCGEEVTGGGLEPEGIRGGGFIELPAANYRLSARRDGHLVLLHFEQLPSSCRDVRNSFLEPVRLDSLYKTP